MSWYYADAGQQAGPVEDAQFDALIASGKITPDTLVWRQGMANWQPLREARPGAASSPAAPPPAGAESAAVPGATGGVVCSQCGQVFPPDQTIRYGDRYVCAGCKPVFLQRLAEGVAPSSAGVPGSASQEEILRCEYNIDIGTCLNRAWELFTANAGLIIGAYLLIGLVSLVLFGLSFGVGLVVPLTNNLINLVITGPLVGGVVWFTLKLIRGEQPVVGDMFSGFSRRAGQLILCSIVQGLLTTACMLPFLIAAGIMGFTAASRRGQINPQVLTGALIAVMVVGLAIGIAAVMYLTTTWIFSYFLLVDKGMKFWDAMQFSRRKVSQRFWMTLLFMFVGGIISGAGVLLCGVGLLVTMPLYWGMLAYLYEDNFRDLAPQG